jgi:hypothetical protein
MEKKKTIGNKKETEKDKGSIYAVICVISVLRDLCLMQFNNKNEAFQLFFNS